MSVRTYVRGDSDKISAQKALLTNFCVFKNFTIVQEYTDLDTLMNDISKGEILLISDLTRLSKSTRGALQIVTDLHQRNISLISLKENLDLSGPMSGIIIPVLSLFYNLETKPVVTENTKPRTRAPFGYKFIGKDKELEPVPAQQEVIQKIKELYAAKKKYLQIANQLNSEGLNHTLSLNKKSSKVCKFHAETIKRILIDEKMIPGKRLPLEDRIRNVPT